MKTFARRTVAKLLDISDRQVAVLAEESGTPIVRSESGVKARLYSPQNIFDIAALKRQKSGVGRKAKRIISTNIPRGGTGKTLISTNLAVCFALAGIKTCLIDLDYQGSATMMFGYDADVDDQIANERNLPKDNLVNYHVGDLMGLPGTTKRTFDEVVKYPYGVNGPALIPGDVTLTRFDTQLTVERLSSPRSDLLMLEMITNNPGFADFEAIIFDTGPGYNRIITTALVASNVVLAPVGLDRVSDKGLRILTNEIEKLRTDNNVSPEVRVIPNMMVNTTRALQELKHINSSYPGQIIPVTIRRSEDVARAYTGASDDQPLYPFILSVPSSDITDALKSITLHLSNELWGEQ